MAMRFDRSLIDDARAVAVPWIVARVLIGVGYIVAVAASDRLVPTDRPPMIGEGLMAWDGTWYRDIAEIGYAGLDPEALRFFPLYPLLGRILGVPLFGNRDLALLLVANIASFALLIGVRRLVRFERGNPALADRAVWLVCLFPGAFVLAWGYAESLWLLAVVVAFWAMRSRRWRWVILMGLVAGATRPLGVALALPALIELLRIWRSATARERVEGGLAVISPLVGTGIYLLWVQRSFGDAFAPFTVQGDLRGDGVDPFSRLWNGFGDLFGAERFADGLHVPFALAFVVLLVLTFRWWPVSYGAFAAVVLLAALGAENLNSLERYGLNALPLVLALAVATRDPRVERSVTVVLAGGVVGLTALAWVGAYVP